MTARIAAAFLVSAALLPACGSSIRASLADGDVSSAMLALDELENAPHALDVARAAERAVALRARLEVRSLADLLGEADAELERVLVVRVVGAYDDDARVRSAHLGIGLTVGGRPVSLAPAGPPELAELTGERVPAHRVVGGTSAVAAVTAGVLMVATLGILRLDPSSPRHRLGPSRAEIERTAPRALRAYEALDCERESWPYHDGGGCVGAFAVRLSDVGEGEARLIVESHIESELESTDTPSKLREVRLVATRSISLGEGADLGTRIERALGTSTGVIDLGPPVYRWRDIDGDAIEHLDSAVAR